MALKNKVEKLDNRIQENLSKYVFGKVPPQARELEEAVLGAMLLEKDAVAPVLLILQADYFYVEAHQHVFDAITTLFENRNPVDLLTVSDLLRKNGTLERCGGAYAISDLTNRVASAANVEYHSRIIMQCYVNRQIIHDASAAIERAYGNEFDALENLKFVASGAQDLYNVIEGQKSKDFRSMVLDTEKIILEAASSEIKIIGKSTGHAELDELIGGRVRGEVTQVAGRPGMGKSAFINQEVKYVALTLKEPIAVFTLETKFVRWCINALAGIMKVNNRLVGSGRIDKDDLKKAVKILADANIFLYDASGLHIYDFRAKVRMLKQKYGIVETVIDYTQLMQGERGYGSNRESEISSISRGIKTTAMDEDIPVIALSQITRDVEKRGGDGRPKLSDLRESGSLEQDADVVQFLHRAEYFGIYTHKQTNKDLRGIMEYITAKQRNGALGSTWYQVTAEWGEYTEVPARDYDGSAYNVFSSNPKAGPVEDDTPF